MNFYEVIAARRSVRNYRPTPISPDKLLRIWEAARLSPSACNLQPWRFLVVKSDLMRARVSKILQPWVMTAPLVVVALGNRDTGWRRDGQSYHEVDVAIAVEHLVLAAAAEGLGTCWICAFDRQGMHRALGLNETWDPVAVTPLGYPDDASPRTPRKPVSEIVREV
jgi:nitroreductase